MTEEQWLACPDLHRLESFLWANRQSDRRWWLFACTRCRTVWHLLTDERSRRGLEVLERYADGQASLAEVLQAGRDVHQACHDGPPEYTAPGSAARAVESALYAFCLEGGADEIVNGVNPNYDARTCALNTRCYVTNACCHESRGEMEQYDYHSPSYPEAVSAWLATARLAETGQLPLLRCIFGNPFRPVTVDPATRTPTALSLAEAAYEERLLPSGELDVTRLAVLADALEEAEGRVEVIEHLRRSGPHVRGCWALDAILGRP